MKKIKRSGRTIIVVSLGVLLFGGLMAWYDGSSMTHRLSEPDAINQEVYESVSTFIAMDYDHDLFLICRSGTGLSYSWTQARHKDPIVSLQIRDQLQAVFPDMEFSVWRFRNVMEMTSYLQSMDLPREFYRGIMVMGGGRIWFDLKFVASMSLGLLILGTVRWVDRTRPKKQ